VSLKNVGLTHHNFFVKITDSFFPKLKFEVEDLLAGMKTNKMNLKDRKLKRKSIFMN